MIKTKKIIAALIIVLIFGASLSLGASARVLRSFDINIPDGFQITQSVSGLSAPTMVSFDSDGRMLVAESGYGSGGEAKITRISPDGTRAVLARGEAFRGDLPVTAVATNDNSIYVAHGGSISRVKPDGTLASIITGLPGQGDHQTNQIVIKDGKMYFGIGTVTNSAVVGSDNAVFGWLKDPLKTNLKDVPCRDIKLSDRAVFESDNALAKEPTRVRTSAFAPYGQELPPGTSIPGNPKCNGAILKANLDGTGLEVHAWGLRNPYGLEVSADGSLYTTMHGFDARGERPIENAWDCLYHVEEGAWYGWPDFACDIPVNDSQFKPKDQPQPEFVVSGHPTENPPKPLAKFSPHSAANGFAFAPNEKWGKPTDAYVALFGDFTPATGTVTEPQGVKVVKVDTQNGQITDFISNYLPGQASRRGAGGLEHPSDVTFGPDGAMYITDWGIARVSEEGLKLEKDSGVIWKVTLGEKKAAALPGGPSLVLTILSVLALIAATALSTRGAAASRRLIDGLKLGPIAGLMMGLFAMLVAAPALELPWFAPPRVLASIIMGRDALANILEFNLSSFLVGIGIVLALGSLLGTFFAWLLHTTHPRRILVSGVIYGLTVWSILQYFIFPTLFPLVTEKGFPPEWYAATFAVYGLALGALLAYWPRFHRQIAAKKTRSSLPSISRAGRRKPK